MLLLARLVFAAALTAVAFIPAALIHGVCRLIDYCTLANKYNSLTVKIKPNSEDPMMTTSIPLGTYLKGNEKDASIQQISWDNSTYKQLTLQFAPKTQKLGGLKDPNVAASVEMNFPEDKEALHALLYNNVGNLAKGHPNVNFGLFGRPSSDLSKSYGKPRAQLLPLSEPYALSPSGRWVKVSQ